MKRGRFARSRLRRRISAETGRVSNHLHPLLVKRILFREVASSVSRIKEKKRKGGTGIYVHIVDEPDTGLHVASPFVPPAYVPIHVTLRKAGGWLKAGGGRTAIRATVDAVVDARASSLPRAAEKGAPCKVYGRGGMRRVCGQGYLYAVTYTGGPANKYNAWRGRPLFARVKVETRNRPTVNPRFSS